GLDDFLDDLAGLVAGFGQLIEHLAGQLKGAALGLRGRLHDRPVEAGEVCWVVRELLAKLNRLALAALGLCEEVVRSAEAAFVAGLGGLDDGVVAFAQRLKVLLDCGASGHGFYSSW